MFTVSDTAQQAARNGPLFIVLNAASGHKDTDEQRQVLADVFISDAHLLNLEEYH